MPLYRFGSRVPVIDPTAYVHPDAVVIGDVHLGPNSSIWPTAVLRGDYGTITIGARSSIQDGSVLHAGPGFPTDVGDDCVVGHLVHLEGCRLENGSLVGSCSVVLHHAVVGSEATVAANAVVPNKMVVPPRALAVGIPAKIREDASDVEMIRLSAAQYVLNAKRFGEDLERLDEGHPREPLH
jgi:carbonic anhydrase/acetyltransferase-like protein (isoleucine patch superfamily)